MNSWVVIFTLIPGWIEYRVLIFYVFLLWGCPHCCCFFLRLSAHNISKKIKSGGVRRGLRHSQSMKGKNHAVATLPGVCEQSVKLQTLRPIILSNIEHIGEYNNCYSLKFLLVNPLTHKVGLIIFPFCCFTYPCELVARIWC